MKMVSNSHLVVERDRDYINNPNEQNWIHASLASKVMRDKLVEIRSRRKGNNSTAFRYTKYDCFKLAVVPNFLA